MTEISYAITACNEHVELDRLLEQLSKNINYSYDEIVVQLDTNATKEVKDIIEKYYLKTPMISFKFPLNGDFAAFKNNLKDQCNKDYICFIDADELLSEDLIQDLSEILTLNPEVDLFGLCRVNKVEGITPEHIKKWGWNIDELERINYPDIQWRICKNIPEIKWKGKVHERLIGARYEIALPDDTILPNDGYHIIHHKTIEKQEQQNKLYSTI